MRFRLVWYDTEDENKYEADNERRVEVIGSRRAGGWTYQRDARL